VEGTAEREAFQVQIEHFCITLLESLFEVFIAGYSSSVVKPLL
jgi:hypothetical protein